MGGTALLRSLGVSPDEHLHGSVSASTKQLACSGCRFQGGREVLAESWKGDMDGILFFVRTSLPVASCNNVERHLTDFDRLAFSLQLPQHSSSTATNIF
jgi:hypothetical protein